jgi:hypothetical protein
LARGAGEGGKRRNREKVRGRSVDLYISARRVSRRVGRTTSSHLPGHLARSHHLRTSAKRTGGTDGFGRPRSSWRAVRALPGREASATTCQERVCVRMCGPELGGHKPELASPPAFQSLGHELARARLLGTGLTGWRAQKVVGLGGWAKVNRSKLGAPRGRDVHFWARCRQSAKQVTGLEPRGYIGGILFLFSVCLPQKARRCATDVSLSSGQSVFNTLSPASMLRWSAIGLRHPENPTANGQ